MVQHCAATESRSQIFSFLEKLSYVFYLSKKPSVFFSSILSIKLPMYYQDISEYRDISAYRGALILVSFVLKNFCKLKFIAYFDLLLPNSLQRAF